MILSRQIAFACAVCLTFAGNAAAMPLTAPQSSITAQAADAAYTEVQAPDGQVTYRVYADHAEACRLIDNNFGAPVSILSEIEGVPVTAIAAKAFQDRGSDLQEITIPDSVKEIGEAAFTGTGIQSLQIPDSVTVIGPKAFSYCSELSELRLPKNLETISDSAFMCCHRLRSVTIPDSVTVIEQYAFAGSSNLENILIPESVQSLRYDSFIGTRWIQSRESSDPFVIVNRILISGKDTEGKLTVPDGVTKIAESTFAFSETLTEVTVPAGVSVIADKAFTQCKNLKDITILNPQCTIVSSEPGMTICNSAEPFDGTDGEVHWKYNFYGTIHGYDGSTAESYAKENGYSFESLGAAPETSDPGNPSSLENQTVTDDAGLIKYLVNEKGNYAYAYGLTDNSYSGTIEILPEIKGVPVKYIAGESFGSCRNLTGAVIPEGVEEIQIGAFFGCESLQTLTLPGTLNKIEEHAFSGCSGLTELTIPGSVTEFANAFNGCTGLKKLTLSEGISRIGSTAFAECTGLTELTIPAGVVRIDRSAFDGCSGLKTLSLPDSLKTVNAFAFADCTSLTKVTLPAGVKTVDYSAFSGCTNLTDITVLDVNCSIYDSAATFGTHDPAGTIRGYNGSSAEAYAKKYGWTFVSLGTAKGDVNGDGSVDLKDVTYMRRAFVGWEDTIDEEAADVNRDGSADLKDLVILRRYLAGGWDVVL